MSRLLAAVVIAGTFGLAPGQASTLTHDFTVTATTGPLAGTSSSGTFSFDSSLAIPNGTYFLADLFSDLSFTWDGIAYDAATANTGWLIFDGSGHLSDFFFGTDCGPGFCSVTSGTKTWWAKPGIEKFVYNTPEDPENLDLGNVTFAAATSEVPEPLTLAFVGAGFAAAVAARRRKTKA